MSPRSLLLLLACLTLPLGCASMTPPVGGLDGLVQHEAASASTSPDLPTCTVDIRAGRQRIIQLPISENMRAQDVLASHKSIRKIRYPEVTIYRQTDNAQQPYAKLACHFNPKSKRLSLTTDYGIRPGDRIVIRPGKNDQLERIFGSLVGPLGG